MASVLIVDDERDLAALVAFNLRQAGFDATVALDAAGALEALRRSVPDVVVLDVMLPDKGGVEVLRTIRGDPRTQRLPVVMLTSRSGEHDRVAAFELGADDYVTKPFSVRELVLRVRAVLRRSGSAAPPGPAAAEDPLVVPPIRVEIAAHRAFVGDSEVALTSLEFKLLVALAERAGRILSREQLLSDVWEVSSGLETRTVDTHVKRLRDKLGPARDQLETVRGVGYRLVAAAPDEPGRPG